MLAESESSSQDISPIIRHRKFCHQCRMRPASIVEKWQEDGTTLRFCTSACLETYKLAIFTKETMFCLQDKSTDSSQSAVAHPAIDGKRKHLKMKGGPDSLLALGRIPPKHRRRVNEPRPHPSYRLNKRFWDDVRAGRRTLNQELGLRQPSIVPSRSRQDPSPVLSPSEMPTASTRPSELIPRLLPPVPPPGGWRIPKTEQTEHAIEIVDEPAIVPVSSIPSNGGRFSPRIMLEQFLASTMLNNTFALPPPPPASEGVIFVPVPVPIPIPIPLTERFIMQHYTAKMR